MCQSEDIPDHHILINNIIFPSYHVVHTAPLKLALHRKPTRSVQFVVLVLCHPHMVVCEERALGLDATGCSEYLLRGQGFEFVAYGVTGFGVRFGGVDDFEDAVVEGVCVDAGGLVDDGLADLVEVAVGVGFFVRGHAVGFFVEDCVVVAVDCWVEACGGWLVRCCCCGFYGEDGRHTSCEDVLVVLGKDTS